MWTRVVWLAGAVVVGLLLTNCGGPDLVLNGSLPLTPTPVTTVTPGACSVAGGFCDNVTTLCCSAGACDLTIDQCAF